MTGKILTRTCGAFTLGIVLTAAFSGVASAADTTPPVAGDTRASAHSGNAQTGDCTVGGLTGSDITSHVTATADGVYIDITAIGAGYAVSGVVVKGGDAYNVYTAASLGAALPWLDLHSPLNPNAQPAGISHWYVCGSTTTPTDVCTNITGLQTATPAGMTNTNGVCATPPPPTDLCTDVDGVQTTVPAGRTQGANSTCPVVRVEGVKTGGEDEVVVEQDDTEVKGVKKSSKPPAAVLPRIGPDLDATGLAGVGVGLLLAGILLVSLPARLALARGLHRRS